MPDKQENQLADTVDRLSIMRKAGLPPWVLVVVTLMSTPGFYAIFLDNTGDIAKKSAQDAEKKADVAYEVLAAELGEIRRDNEQLRVRIQNLNNVMMLLLQKGIGVERPTEVDIIHDVVNTPVHGTAPSRRSRGGSSDSSGYTAAPLSDLVPPGVLEDMVDQNEEEPPEQRKALPEDLDSLMN